MKLTREKNKKSQPRREIDGKDIITKKDLERAWNLLLAMADPPEWVIVGRAALTALDYVVRNREDIERGEKFMRAGEEKLLKAIREAPPE